MTAFVPRLVSIHFPAEDELLTEQGFLIHEDIAIVPFKIDLSTTRSNLDLWEVRSIDADNYELVYAEPLVLIDDPNKKVLEDITQLSFLDFVVKYFRVDLNDPFWRGIP